MTVASIKTAAMELARADGFASLNTIAIAERAGIGVGSLYEYFPNKEAILLSLFEETTGQLVELFRAKLPQLLEADLRSAIRGTTAEILKAYQRNRLILIDLPQQMPELRSSVQAASFDHLVHGSLRIFLGHHRHGEKPALLEHRAFFIESTLIGAIQRYLLTPPPNLPAKAFLEHVTVLIENYVEAPLGAAGS